MWCANQCKVIGKITLGKKVQMNCKIPFTPSSRRPLSHESLAKTTAAAVGAACAASSGSLPAVARRLPVIPQPEAHRQGVIHTVHGGIIQLAHALLKAFFV